MLKEIEKGAGSVRGQIQRKEDWHYDFAAKMISKWPEWKKEIYVVNFSNGKKEVVGCK